MLLVELKWFTDALMQSEAPLTRKGSDDSKFWHITDVRVHLYLHSYIADGAQACLSGYATAKLVLLHSSTLQ